MLQASMPNLHYYTPPKYAGVHHGFKAGNINQAMRHVETLEGGPGEYFAILDADMIPESQPLRALIPHVVNSPRIAMAIPPQRFYNIPLNDPLYQTKTLKNKTDEVVRDYASCTWCTGSGFVRRRSALLDIGGFPQTTLAEDVMCSFMPHGRGWKIVFVHEELQWGLVPESFAEHVMQRTNRVVGELQNSITLQWCISSRLLPQMGLYQQAAGILYSLSAWAKLPPLFVLPLCLLSKQTMVAHTGPKDLQRLLTSSLAVMIFGSSLHDWVTILPGCFVDSFRRIQGQTWLAPYRLKAVIQNLLPLHLVGTRMGFTPSGSIKSSISERDINLRKQILPRLRAMLWHHGVAFHLGFLILVVASLGVSIRNSIVRCETIEKAWLSLITHALYPGLPWLEILALFTPLTYTIWPPSMPPRRALMVKDEVNGNFRPSQERKVEQRNGWFWANGLWSLLVPCWAIYAIFLVGKLRRSDSG